MASPIPAKLKAADLSRFVLRATQLEKFKPVVAYWCSYWVLKQIIEKNLQNADSESLQYTTQLMDKIEQTKAVNPENDAILDDVAAKVYVEQFALETFQRADNAVRANKASMQTADTFLAAATFLELGQIWGELDPEIISKLKFARYHSVRIAKAVKAGEDPNLSNPVQEPDEMEIDTALDPNDPEVQALNASAPNPEAGKRSRQPSVVEVQDEHDQMQRNLARKSLLDESLHPSRAPSIPRAPEGDVAKAPSPGFEEGKEETFYKGAEASGQDEVSPIAPSMDRSGSVGGGYFPQVPGAAASSPSTSSSAPSNYPAAPMGRAVSPIAPSGPTYPPHNVASQPGPPAVYQAQAHFSPQDLKPQPPQPGAYPPPPVSSGLPPSHFQGPQPSTGRQYHAGPPSAAQAVTYPPPQVAAASNVVVDEEAIAKAQKHARWAISALNFEDVNTAIRELRGALQTLGAQ